LGREGRDPRIAFLITSSGVGGAEHQVRDLALGLRSRGMEVAAVSMLPIDSSFEALMMSGIETSSLAMTRGIPDPRALGRLRAWLGTWRPDVLHAHMVHANLLARLARAITNVPVVVCTMHSQNQGPRWRSLAYRLTDRLSDVTTSVSAVARRDAVRTGAAPAGRIIVMHNGVDLSRYGPGEAARARSRQELNVAGVFVWLAAGRLTEAKDYPNLIAACGSLRHSNRDWRLVIAGSGPLDDALKRQVRAAGLDDKIQFLGQRADMPDVMRAADAFILSSAWEGLPLVLLEASASGLPIVATEVGGNGEAVIDGENGYLVPARDSGALAGAMSRVMDSTPEERARLGAAGRRHIVATFDMESVLDRWVQVYRDALAARSQT
jgi:glycosyltransferase involved in cell wall biosynthesis